jgi:hypothetical protein
MPASATLGVVEPPALGFDARNGGLGACGACASAAGGATATSEAEAAVGGDGLGAVAEVPE